MNTDRIGKMILDGNVVEIIMRELQISRKDAIRLWYQSDTRKIVQDSVNGKSYISGQICFEDLMREQQGQEGILKQFLSRDGGVDEKEK